MFVLDSEKKKMSVLDEKEIPGEYAYVINCCKYNYIIAMLSVNPSNAILSMFFIHNTLIVANIYFFCKCKTPLF